jgi:hypothetical protein
MAEGPLRVAIAASFLVMEDGWGRVHPAALRAAVYRANCLKKGRRMSARDTLHSRRRDMPSLC